MDKYKDPVFVRLVSQYLEENKIMLKEFKELSKGIVAIRDSAGDFVIYFDMRIWRGPVSISISNKARIGRLLGKTRTPPVKNFAEALNLAKEILKKRRREKWEY